MKIFLTILLFACFLKYPQAQAINYEDFRSIIPFLQTEDFKSAFEISGKLLNATEDDSSDLRGIVTYMNIFSGAGMVSTDLLSHDSFSNHIRRFIGHTILMSAHPCVDSLSTAFNSLKFVMKDGELQGMVTTANDKRTSILCFEYFKYAAPIRQEDFIGKNVRCGGLLESVEINPNKSTIWIARLYIRDAFARAIIPR